MPRRQAGIPAVEFRVTVDEHVAYVLAATVDVGGMELPFAAAAQHFAAAYREGGRLVSAPGARCGGCQFSAAAPPAAASRAAASTNAGQPLSREGAQMLIDPTARGWRS